MLDIGGWEIFVILALALIIVGPKDLPVLVRRVGTWVGKARAMARDFQSGMNEAAREMELDELKKTADIGKSADLGRVMREETRQINSDMRRPADGGARPSSAGAASSARAASGSSAPGAGAASAPSSARAVAPERHVSENAPQPAERRAPAPRDAEDDSVLADFQRGVRGSRDL